jgi:copper transport protein
MIRAFLAASACLLAVMTADTRAAQAHATLLSSLPADGAMVASAPSIVTLKFNEPVMPAIVRLIAPDGMAITLPNEASGETLEFKLPALGIGTHVLSWRVTSADGHPVGGSLLFSVGRASIPVNAATQTSASIITATAFARLALYIGLFFGVGGVFFRLWIVELPLSALPLVRWSLRLGLAAVVPALGLQGLDLLGAPFANIADGATWRAAAETSLAATLALAAVAMLIALAILLVPVSHAIARYATLAAFGLGAAAFAASGHASNAPPQWFMRPTIWLHTACVALWAGSLWPLYHLLREKNGRPAIARFTDFVPMPFLALLASGFALAVVQIDRLEDLPSSGYGKIFIAKMLLVVALLVVAGQNRLVLTPALISGDRRAPERLGRSILAEIVLVLAIFTLVTLWRFMPPPRVMAVTEPVFVHIHDRRAMADLTLTPGRAGPLSATINLMRDDFTRLPAKEVELAFSNPSAGVEPISRQALQGADGLWRTDEIILPVAGRWETEIRVLVNDFERLVLDAPVLVAR